MLSLGPVSWKPLARGLLSHLPVSGWRNPHKTGMTIDPLYSYAVFTRHFGEYCTVTGAAKPPAVLCEVGPGSSLGVGLLALLLGSERYLAFDNEAQADHSRNQRAIVELTHLLRSDTSAPVRDFWSGMFPMPVNENIDQIICKLKGDVSCRAVRIAAAIKDNDQDVLTYTAPWKEADPEHDAAVDWLISHSVLEHVDDLASLYARMARMVKRGGIMTHLVDFWSHGLSPVWNGHWAITDRGWKVMAGKRSYLLNRVPWSVHEQLLRENGFQLLGKNVERRSDGFVPSRMAAGFKAMNDEDARSRMVFFSAEKL